MDYLSRDYQPPLREAPHLFPVESEPGRIVAYGTYDEIRAKQLKTNPFPREGYDKNAFYVCVDDGKPHTLEFKREIATKLRKDLDSKNVGLVEVLRQFETVVGFSL